MQIATSLFYDRSSRTLTSLASKAETLQNQISTGTKFTAPSQDSTAYQRLAGLARDTANDVTNKANLKMAASVLAQGDTTLSSISDQLQRATELTTRAKTGTLSAADRKVIGDELATIVETIAGFANAKDIRGQALFGGGDGTAAVGPPAAPGATGGYALATQPVSSIPYGEGAAVQTNETAARVLMVGGTVTPTGIEGGKNTLLMLSAIATALQTGVDETGALDTALTDISAASDQVTTIQASLGARASRVDLETARLTSVGVDREASRSGIEDTDITNTVIELQKTMTILSATQASFSKLSSLSLFDYLR